MRKEFNPHMYHNCKICNNETLYEEIKQEVVNDTTVRYSICKVCGLVQQMPTYSQTFYHNLPCCFPSDYDNHAGRRAQYILDFINPSEGDSLKILDVGCGPGKVMEYMSQVSGHDCYGYTVSGKETDRIKIKNVETSVLNDWSDFDVIIMSHVVEHFLTPVKTLKNLSGLLRPGGLMYIEVPSFYWGEVRSPQIFTPEHISFFTQESIINLLIKSNLCLRKIKESRYWGNIKMLCRKFNSYTDDDLIYIDYMNSLKYYRKVKLLYPFYRLMKKLKKVGPND